MDKITIGQLRTASSRINNHIFEQGFSDTFIGDEIFKLSDDCRNLNDFIKKMQKENRNETTISELKKNDIQQSIIDYIKDDNTWDILAKLEKMRDPDYRKTVLPKQYFDLMVDRSMSYIKNKDIKTIKDLRLKEEEIASQIKDLEEHRRQVEEALLCVEMSMEKLDSITIEKLREAEIKLFSLIAYIKEGCNVDRFDKNNWEESDFIYANEHNWHKVDMTYAESVLAKDPFMKNIDLDDLISQKKYLAKTITKMEKNNECVLSLDEIKARGLDFALDLIEKGRDKMMNPDSSQENFLREPN